MIDKKSRDKILAANLSNIVRKVKAGKPLTKGELELISDSEKPAGEQTLPDRGRAQAPLKKAASMGAAIADLKTLGYDVTKAFLKKIKLQGGTAAGFLDSNRVDLALLIPYLKALAAAPVTGPAPLTKESIEIRKLLAQAEKIEHELAQMQGVFVTRTAVVQSNRRVAGELNKLWRKLEDEGPAAVAGKDLAEAREWFARQGDQHRLKVQSWCDEWPE
ncbi:MAG TPA: hypothetical protein VNT99_08310 [Methylomirabilota bacterium]|nr:hypothetical protein [Methylomirabilota bacterium]